MRSVNLLEAESSLSRLEEAIERGEEHEIVIARNGRPAAKLVAIETSSVQKRIGVAAGQFVVPENIDAHNDAVAQAFIDRFVE